jgi:phytoene synthase
MQLSNIARDVSEDAAMGRLYLPMSWLREAGLDPEHWPARLVHCEALERVVQRLLGHADTLYARAAAGIAELPLACRPGINAARLLYAAIGHAVACDVAGSLQRRTVVAKRRRTWLMARAIVTPWPSAGGLHAPVLPANEAMVRAAAFDGTRGAPVPEKGVAFIVDLFTRLERRDHGARGALR